MGTSLLEDERPQGAEQRFHSGKSQAKWPAADHRQIHDGTQLTSEELPGQTTDSSKINGHYSKPLRFGVTRYTTKLPGITFFGEPWL